MICLTAENTELSQGVFPLESDMHTIAHTEPRADINIVFRFLWPFFATGEEDNNQGKNKFGLIKQKLPHYEIRDQNWVCHIIK